MRDLPLLQNIAEAAVRVSTVPISAKLRSGWDAESINVVEAAKRLEDVGVRMLAIHPRTQTMQFKGKADWRLIAAVKQAVAVPVIGNGDVQSPDDAVRMFLETGCDAVMIGRAACGNPWIFQRTKQFLRTGIMPSPPSFEQRVKICLRHLELSVEHYGERRAVQMMRKQMLLYLKGVPNIAEIRKQVVTCNTFQAVEKVLFGFLELLQTIYRNEAGA